MVYANFNLYLVIQRMLLHTATRWTTAVQFVDSGLWIFDFLAVNTLVGKQADSQL